MSTQHKLSLSVQYASNAKKLPTRQQLRRWVKVALERDVQMALRIVDEIEGRALNLGYRNKDYATNVLTFVYDDVNGLGNDATPKNEPHDARFPLPNTPPVGRAKRGGRSRANESLHEFHLMPLYGDIVICAPVVAREAKEQSKDLLAHYAHLTIHAALHLQGYDHEKKREAKKMEERETALMLKLRYPAPYLIR